MGGEDVNLGLTLGSTSHCIQTMLDNSSDAGANANSTQERVFANSITELVWSPHKGLGFKYTTNRILADKRTSPRGPDNKGSGDFLIPWALLDENDIYSREGSSFMPCVGGHDTESNIVPDEEAAKDICPVMENYKDIGDGTSCHPQNSQTADISKPSDPGLNSLAGGTSEKQVGMEINVFFPTTSSGETRCNQNSDIEIHTESRNIVVFDVNHGEHPAPKLRDVQLCPPPNLEYKMELADEATPGTNKYNKTKSFLPVPAPLLKKLEPSAKNDLYRVNTERASGVGVTKIPRGTCSVESSPTCTRIPLYQGKEKAKALSDGDIYGRSVNHEDDNHESVESCNSVGLFSKGIKRQSNDPELISRGKRMKRQILESTESRFIAKPDNSFMRWVSNMVKGPLECINVDYPSLDLTLSCSNDAQECRTGNKMQEDPAIRSTGFQTLFKSLYCGKTNSSKQEETKGYGESVLAENLPGLHDNGSDNSNEMVVLDEENPQILGHPSKQIFSSELAEKQVSDIAAKFGEKTSPGTPLGMNDMPEKGKPQSSLWITRLSMRNARSGPDNKIPVSVHEHSADCLKAGLNSPKGGPIKRKSSEAHGATEYQVYASEKESRRSTSSAEELIDFKSTIKSQWVVSSQKYGSSEAMSSVFARRLEALRHTQSSELGSSSSRSMTCFFCGKGHDLQECPYVSESELVDLQMKMSSVNKIKESSLLCIRCSQSDHWAISCPLASSSFPVRSQPVASVSQHYTDSRPQLSAGNEKCPSDNVQEEDPKMASAEQTSNRGVVPNAKIFQNIPPCSSLPEQNTAAPLDILHAIKNLRLSRGDILRWMNSNSSLSDLNGFFLRLRLGNSEAGVEENRYYVGCITGDVQNDQNYDYCKSKKSILVDIGGVKSSVGSQYVSNHDFLEDEIKAWWCRTVESGCSIPSSNELNSKYNHRKSMGF